MIDSDIPATYKTYRGEDLLCSFRAIPSDTEDSTTSRMEIDYHPHNYGWFFNLASRCSLVDYSV